ncbi:MAG: hypothetical protein NTX52_14105 [Planctomycetota bacterium]|nr:hypothetical protein [Planctomycetota bacterium]
MGDALSVYESSRDVCYYQFAVKEDVPSLCNLTLENASCWKDFAIKTGNTTFCEEIQEPNDRNSCLAEVTSDISYCDKIVPEHSDAASNISFSEEFNAESDRVWCYIHVANRTQNASICEIGRGQKGLDNEFCYSMAGFCDLVENEDDKINCFSMETANVSYCDLSFNMEMSKALIGSESNESHYKTAIFNRDVCYEVQAALQRNISLCYKINDEKSKEYCYSTVAVKHCDPLLCDINVDRHDKDECIGWIIKSQCMLR